MGRHLLEFVRRIFSHSLTERLAGIAVIVVLYGAVASEHVLVAIALYAGVRGFRLIPEAFEKERTEADWRARYQTLLVSYSTRAPDELEQECIEYGLEGACSASALARVVTDDERARYRPPRAVGTVVAEILGIATFLVLIPATLVFLARDFASYRGMQDWRGVLILAACAAALVWPSRWPASAVRDRNQLLWWGLPTLLALPLFVYGLTVRHPYLNPLAANHLRLAADKVLSLEDNVTAGRHADWIFRYGEALEQAGDVGSALDYYRRGLQLSPQSPQIHARVARLEGRDVDRRSDPYTPYWDATERVPELRACSLDAGLGTASTTVVLVHAGEVDPEITRRVGDVLQREMRVAVCLATQKLPLPAHARTRGLLGGQQWRVETLAEGLVHLLDAKPRGPLKYLVITDADIFSDGANFLFSASFQFGAVLSTARYRGVNVNAFDLYTRVTKQALGATIKSFGVSPSADSRCVTSYSNGLDQFDAKGNRPVSATRMALEHAVAKLEASWKSPP